MCQLNNLFLAWGLLQTYFLKEVCTRPCKGFSDLLKHGLFHVSCVCLEQFFLFIWIILRFYVTCFKERQYFLRVLLFSVDILKFRILITSQKTFFSETEPHRGRCFELWLPTYKKFMPRVCLEEYVKMSLSLESYFCDVPCETIWTKGKIFVT